MIIRPQNRQPDWRNIAAVLEKKIPQRPTLFELFMDAGHIQRFSGMDWREGDVEGQVAATIAANDHLGYDYVIQTASGFSYPAARGGAGETISLNDAPTITDRESFDRYPWPNAADFANTQLEVAGRYLPEGMKLMIWSADGLLETVIKLTGYDNLCYLLYDDPELVSDLFERIGQGYLTYFTRCIADKNVMALVSSDDWGFNTQTMLAPDVLRKYLFPWQKEYVQLAHLHGKYAVLHSCGCFHDIIDDVVALGFDARHSYEDNILPVEQAYQQLCGRLAVLGGLDVDFLVRATPEEIAKRAGDMLMQSASRGGYALGSGNSIADYMPAEHYLAMITQAWK